MKAVELFAGAGGLALGAHDAGFEHDCVLEWNRNACETIRENNQRKIIDWPLHECDVRNFDFKPFAGIDLLTGGPPCQPFSIGGKHKGNQDHRNMFPEVIRAIRETQPRAVMIENVKGLLRSAFSKFFAYVLHQIEFPEIVQKDDEDWISHLSRLEQHKTSKKSSGLEYKVVFRKLNAADYGAPQRRERVFIVAFRSDIEANWSFPEPTHSHEALVFDQWVTGDYWHRHMVPRKNRPVPTFTQVRIAKNLETMLIPIEESPWLTVRDGISGLPKPRVDRETFANHKTQPGARSYKGHTGSPIDEAGKTLKAGDHGVPGGENMILFNDGSVRYLTIRESARLQTFPDEYYFEGSWTESMRQLGNAVPVRLANAVAKSVHACLKRACD
ncbi:DNA cytosine methyltransferase [Neorhodopirellula pilleata]|uniref:DNA (cytosine-5-)-methyltransferase n=1 Tax=Neorhodopirellula pilleata TaxID=2714738 RepID=A0A5C6AD17_9BACT|nr:DNA cytosine methyltransferase [Neorhodopirellula pilleata]TWT97307.1 Modification methylase HaeIII [Neorhodopirellula pilleata]